MSQPGKSHKNKKGAQSIKDNSVPTHAHGLGSVHDHVHENPSTTDHFPHNHDHDHKDGNHAHSHSHGKISHSSHDSHDQILDLDEDDGCTHVAANTTSCGHIECLSEYELKARSARRTLMYVACFCFTFMCIELIGGYLSNSLAIMTDAAHLLSDLVSFMISLIALFMSTKRPTSSYSFGFHRAEIIGALLSVLLIWGLTVYLVYEAIQRIRKPEPINGPLMFGTATLGLIVNLIMGGILISSGQGHSHGGLPGANHGHSHGFEEDDHGHSHNTSYHHEKSPLLESATTYGTTPDSEHLEPVQITNSEGEGIMDIIHSKKRNINIRAALLHVLGDAVQSLGVILAAIVVWMWPQYSIADPICTFFFSIIVLGTTMRILKDGFLVLMEGVPAHINRDDVLRELRALKGVIRVHELHIWSLSLGNTALSVHLLTDGETSDILSAATDMLQHEFEITHTTIQIEKATDDVSCLQPTKRHCTKDV